MNLSENLKKIRKQHNLSQEQLAEKLGVSRQSVSKWESNQAYPEMDKVIQLTKLFNLNMDELLNQDISETTKEKQSKNILNKYIEEILNFTSKTVNMFINMSLKNKIKCILEQIIIALLLTTMFFIIGTIGLYIVEEIAVLLPYNIGKIITKLFKIIYIVFGITTSITLIIHIFKTRYLDYYIIEDNKDIKQTSEEIKENKKEKIIIRDPIHSEYNFISKILKLSIFIIKIFVFSIAMVFSISLIILALLLILSLLVMKTGLFFLGLILTIISCIIINIIVLIILFNFIQNKKSNKKPLLIIFVLQLLLCGIGIGTIILGITKFELIEDLNNEIYITDELIINIGERSKIYDMSIYNTEEIEYVEENRKDVRIEYKHTKDYQLEQIKYNNNDNVYLILRNKNNNIIEKSNQIIKDLNDKKIVNYSKYKITIYTSKENIKRLKDNY